MASQLRWTSKSVDLLLEAPCQHCRAAIEPHGLETYYAGKRRIFKAAAAMVVCRTLGYRLALAMMECSGEGMRLKKTRRGITPTTAASRRATRLRCAEGVKVPAKRDAASNHNPGV